MSRKKPKKPSSKIIHYVQLRTHRQWSNELTYLSHLGVYHSKIKPITYDIDRILNNKWIQIGRSQLINQLNAIYQEEIKKNFSHKTNLIDSKYLFINNQFDENNKFIREIFIGSIEIIDYLLYLYKQIEYSERQIYEYRLNILKYEFEQERESLKHLFINQELKELDNQINVLIAMEEDNSLRELIQFQLQKQQLKEKFFKDISILHGNFETQITTLRSTINQTIHSNDQQISIISKHCHYLYNKTRKEKEHINKEMISINILKRKIKETKKVLDDIDVNRNHINDKVNQLIQCSQNKKKTKVKNYSNEFISKKYFLQNSNQIIFRRLSVVIDNVQKNCQKKLLKAERLLLLINQCHRLELENEKVLLSTSNIDSNKILSQVHYLNNCHVEFDSFFDELSLFWKRYAHIQMDIFIRIQEKTSKKKISKFLKNQLKVLV